MKVLVITETLGPAGGWSTYSRAVVSGLTANGHTVIALVAQPSQANLCPEESGMPPPLSLLDSRIACLLAAWKIRRAVRKHRPDIVHVLIEPYALAMPIVRLFMSLPPWAMNMHGTYSALLLQLPRTRRLMEHAYLQAASLLVCSSYTLKQATDALKQYSSDATLKAVQQKVIPFRLGIAPSPNLPVKKTDATTKHVLFVGMVKSRKGVRELIEGFELFMRRNPVPVQLSIVGQLSDGDQYVQELRSYVASHPQLRDHVTFHGRLSAAALEKEYAQADVFVMLSKKDGPHFEGFGLVFLEANARGVPVIGSKDSGCEEAVEEGVSGFSVLPSDTDAIADRLHRILIQNNIDPAACVRWAQKHSIEAQTKSIEAAYAAAVNTQG